jgi:hypothetical protein
MSETPEGVGPGTPLAEWQGLTAVQLRRFEALRILTAEELLAMSGCLEHRQRLATYLGMSLGKLDGLLADLQEQLELGGVVEVESENGEQQPRRDPGPGPDPQESTNAHEPMEQREMARKRLKDLKPQPLSSGQLGKLRKLHVTTAEDLISLTARSKSRQLLAAHLEVSSRELGSILSQVKAQLDPRVVRDMMKSDPGGPRQGVLDRIPEAKRRGRRRG